MTLITFFSVASSWRSTSSVICLTATKVAPLSKYRLER